MCRRPAIMRRRSPGRTCSKAICIDQLGLIIRNHGVPVTVSESTTPIPLHFAFLEGTHVEASVADRIKRPLRDLFDVPDLNGTDDHIANGTFEAAFRRAAAAGAVHRAAHRLFAAPAVALHGDQPAAFPELRAVHQLPVLHRRILRPCARADGQGRRRLYALRRAGQRRHAGRRERAAGRRRRRRACRRCRPIT